MTEPALAAPPSPRNLQLPSPHPLEPDSHWPTASSAVHSSSRSTTPIPATENDSDTSNLVPNITIDCSDGSTLQPSIELALEIASPIDKLAASQTSFRQSILRWLCPPTYSTFHHHQRVPSIHPDKDNSPSHRPRHRHALSLWTDPHLGEWITDVRSRLHRRRASLTPLVTPRPPTADTALSARIFLESFGQGLCSCGLPMHAVEFYLHLAADRLQQQIGIVSLQSTLFITFDRDTTCHLLVAEKPGTSLSRMTDMCHVAETIVQGRSGAADCLVSVQDIMHRPPQWSGRWQLACYVLVSALYTPLFSGGWVEMLIACLSGLLIGLLDVWKARNRSLARGHDLLSGLFCSILAVLINEYVISINVLAACLSGVVWMLPGLRICLAVMDISSGHSITGSGKLLSGLLTAINIGIGITCGLQLQSALSSSSPPSVTHSSSVFPEWSLHLSVLIAVFPSVVLMDASYMHAPILGLGMLTAYEISTMLTSRIGSGFASFVASAAVSCVSNLYERWTPHPSVELYLFSVLVIVPGSVGVRGILASDTATALSFLFEMVGIVIAIVTGWYGGMVLVPPLRVM